MADRLCQCGAELIGEEELGPGECIPCQRGGRVSPRPEMPPPDSQPRHSGGPGYFRPTRRTEKCDACNGRGGAPIVSLAEGETWERCEFCHGHGTIRVEDTP